jgi:hypothetical protein
MHQKGCPDHQTNSDANYAGASFGPVIGTVRSHRMNDKVFSIFVVALIGIGLFLGYSLSNRPSFSVSGILNVIGILYNLTAVMVLYETFAQDSRLQKLAVGFFAPLVLWVNTLIPLGMALSWFLTRGTLHGGAVASFGLSFFVYSIVPLSFLDAAVVFPRMRNWKPIDFRYRRLGLFLLLSGLGIQPISAVISI